MVLLALVDVDYNFLDVGMRGSGRYSEVGIFANSSLGQALQAGTITMPTPLTQVWNSAICDNGQWGIPNENPSSRSLAWQMPVRGSLGIHLQSLQSPTHCWGCFRHSQPMLEGVSTPAASVSCCSWQRHQASSCRAKLRRASVARHFSILWSDWDCH